MGPRTRCDKGVATLSKDFHQVVSQIATGQIQTHDGVGQSVTFIDGHVVGHAITRVQHNTCAGNSLSGNVKSRVTLAKKPAEDSPVVRPEA